MSLLFYDDGWMPLMQKLPRESRFFPYVVYRTMAFRCLWWVVWVRGDAGRVGWRRGYLSPVHRRASVAVTLEGGVRGLP